MNAALGVVYLWADYYPPEDGVDQFSEIDILLHANGAAGHKRYQDLKEAISSRVSRGASWLAESQISETDGRIVWSSKKQPWRAIIMTEDMFGPAAHVPGKGPWIVMRTKNQEGDPEDPPF